jgi:uncharacterized protein YlxW (UPF0749 family)
MLRRAGAAKISVNDAVARITVKTCDGGGGVIHIFANPAE